MMTNDVSSTSAPTSGKGLSRPVIVQAAIEAIDRSGFQNLTMRSLGRDLGVEAMALYRYVSGREDLLEAVVAQLLNGLHARIDSQYAESWQGYLQSFAHAVRKTAAAHPAAFPLIATRHRAAPSLLPPLRSLNRTGLVGVSIVWKRGWTHAEGHDTGEADDTSV